MAGSSGRVLTAWRRYYTDACILRSLSDIELSTKAAIARLDRAIIIAGAAGHDRLELIHVLIRKAQVEFLGASSECDGIRPTSITLSLRLPSQHCHQPFILRGFAHSWPALQEHSWSSLEYLLFVAGPGRVVPVEVGLDYRDNDWSQRLMDWQEFLAHTGLGGNIVQSDDDQTPTLYLAQHNLLMQFPALRDDICVLIMCILLLLPFCVRHINHLGTMNNSSSTRGLGPRERSHRRILYVSKSPRPTNGADRSLFPLGPILQLLLLSNSMYPVAQLGSPHDSGGSVGTVNTSAVDVFGESDGDGSFPAFWADVVPHAMSATLEPGDQLSHLGGRIEISGQWLHVGLIKATYNGRRGIGVEELASVGRDEEDQDSQGSVLRYAPH
ncbi:RAM signaling network component [Salix suchowensis]|nr:RAM signaling network component [Salix suchowensis]